MKLNAPFIYFGYLLFFSKYTSTFLLYCSIIIFPFITLFFISMIVRMTPEYIPSLIPESCAYATLPGKRDFADVIKTKALMIWRLSYIVLVGWTQSNHMSPQKERTFSGWSTREVKVRRYVRGGLYTFAVLEMRGLCTWADRWP